MRFYFKILFLLILSAFIVSCSTLSVTKGRMLKTPVNFPYNKFDSLEKSKEYKIAIDDEIRLNMFSNDGYNMINLGLNQNQNQNQNVLNGISYKVRPDSSIKVPLIGKIKVAGLTLDSLENVFENLLAAQFQSPFVSAQIDNKRIYIFSGISSATVFKLINQNTTLFEVFANVGGIQGGGNASKIKIIRGDLKNPKIYLVNLSTIDGMKDANLIMQAGDIIYIEPIINYANIVLSDVTNVISSLTTIVLIYTLIGR